MAEKLLSKKLGEVEVDGLVTAIDPHIVIGAGVIRKASSGTLKLTRGTVLAKSTGTAGDNKLVVLGTAAASLLAVIPLTILTRVFAILQKTPVTVFLLSGIFPLVPGAGIYYTAYYFIQGDNALALSNGISTFKVAVALAVGISLVLSIPLPPRHRSG